MIPPPSHPVLESGVWSYKDHFQSSLSSTASIDPIDIIVIDNTVYLTPSSPATTLLVQELITSCLDDLVAVVLVYMHAKLLHSCLTLGDPMDCSPPGSSVHGILQVRILEWVAMPSSRGTSRPRDWTPCLLHLLHWQMGSSLLARPGKPQLLLFSH